MRVLLSCAWMSWLALAPVAALAQAEASTRVVVLAPSLESERALREQVLAGLALVPIEVAQARDAEQSSLLSACRAVECARDAMAAAGASFAVIAHVSGLEVELQLIDAAGTRQRAAVALHGFDGASHAVAEAFERARLAFDIGVDGALRVTSSPVGAVVSVDGAVVGITPSNLRVKPGSYDVSVSSDGFVPNERRVSASAGAVEPAEFTLERRVGMTARSAPAPVLDYVLGSALVLAALPAVLIPLDTLAREGQCDGRRDPRGRCSEVVYFGGSSVALLSSGVLALAIGTYLFAATPFTPELEVTSDGATAALAGRF